MLIGRLSQMSPPPCLYDTVIQSYVQLKSGSLEDGPFHGPSYTIESQWGKFCTSCPPGVQLLPHFEVWSYRACQPLQMWQISHFCEIHSLSYEASKFFNIESMGQIWDAPAPQGCNFYPILRYGLTEPASLFKCGFKFLKFSLSYDVKVCPMLSMRIFAPILPLGQTSYPRSLIKVIAHDSRLGRTFWHLIHGSVTKTVGGVARRNKSGRRRIIIISMSNNKCALPLKWQAPLTRMYISRRKCEWCLQWQKTPPGC